MKQTFTTKTGRKVFLWHDGRTFRIKANVRGTVVRRSSVDKDEAIAIAKSIVADVDKGIDPDLQLTMRQRCEYLEAVEQLGPGVKLKDVVDFYLKHHTKNRGTLASLKPLLIDALTKQGRTERRIREVSKVFDNLIAIHKDRPMEEITPDHLDKYLSKYKHPVTRCNNERIISRIWSFAQKHKHVPYNTSTAAEQLIRVPVPHKDPELCPMPLLKQYLKAAQETHPHLIPHLTLAAFAGLRTAEISRLKWGDIKLDDNTIRLSSEITKTRRRRLGVITGNLTEWLEPFLEKAKPDDLVSVAKPENHFRILRSQHNLPPIPPNSLRHTAATMFIASGQRIENVAQWLGNSSNVLEVHYKGLATSEQSKEYFEIYPDTVRTKEPLPRAWTLPLDKKSREWRRVLKFMLTNSHNKAGFVIWKCQVTNLYKPLPPVGNY